MTQPPPEPREGAPVTPVDSLLMRPIYLPCEHLPTSAGPVWVCRTCATPWPCPTARPYLQELRCTCGSPTQWEKNGPRHWHPGPACYSDTDVMEALVEELHQKEMAHPRFPPSHYYPEKPRRPRRQRPPYDHTPMGPGDIRPGTWVWVSPGGLHPGWGDIHRLAMLTALGAPYCEVWMDDTTVHRVRAEKLILSNAGREAARAARITTMRQATGARPRPLLPEWRWVDWTLAEHISHQEQRASPKTQLAVQDELFSV